jgi:hypothetical protein
LNTQQISEEERKIKPNCDAAGVHSLPNTYYGQYRFGQTPTGIPEDSSVSVLDAMRQGFACRYASRAIQRWRPDIAFQLRNFRLSHELRLAQGSGRLHWFHFAISESRLRLFFSALPPSRRENPDLKFRRIRRYD